MDDQVYLNSPLTYLPHLEDTWYLEQYRQSDIIICTGQGAWENGQQDARALKRILEARNIPCWVDLWRYDVNHDWPWWRKQMLYSLGRFNLPRPGGADPPLVPPAQTLALRVSVPSRAGRVAPGLKNSHQTLKFLSFTSNTIHWVLTKIKFYVRISYIIVSFGSPGPGPHDVARPRARSSNRKGGEAMLQTGLWVAYMLADLESTLRSADAEARRKNLVRNRERRLLYRAGTRLVSIGRRFENAAMPQPMRLSQEHLR